MQKQRSPLDEVAAVVDQVSREALERSGELVERLNPRPARPVDGDALRQPPQLACEVVGFDTLVVRLPALESERPWLKAAVVALMAPICAVAFLASYLLAGIIGLFTAIPLVALAALSAWGAADRESGTDHELRFSPGKLTLGERTIYLADVSAVRWECADPETTLVLDHRDGPVRLECARRGFRGSRGVTRRQREWLSALIAARMDGDPGAIPASLAALRQPER